MDGKELISKIKEDYKYAIKSKKLEEKEIINYLISQINYKKIDTQSALEYEDIISIVKKEIKSREEAKEYYLKVGDKEGEKKESTNIKILEKYLPKMLSEEELKKIVGEKIQELSIEDTKKQRGVLIKEIMNVYGPQVDGKLLNKVVDQNF